MNTHDLILAGHRLVALGSGALWWPEQALLCVSDLHFGKSERAARRFGAVLPPYETRDTLARLAGDLDATRARAVVCLGDSFDDAGAAEAICGEDRLFLTGLQAGRDWIWIAGNHDPAPLDLGGAHRAELVRSGLVFRHIARKGAAGEISGHYHPKACLRLGGASVSRRAFLVDRDRIVMPAYGTYTGGLRSEDAALASLMREDALAILTGPRPCAVPMPRERRHG